MSHLQMFLQKVASVERESWFAGEGVKWNHSEGYNHIDMSHLSKASLQTVWFDTLQVCQSSVWFWSLAFQPCHNGYWPQVLWFCLKKHKNKTTQQYYNTSAKVSKKKNNNNNTKKSSNSNCNLCGD